MTKPVAAETPSRILGRLRSGIPWRIADEERDREQTGEHGPQAGEHERLEVVQGEPRRDRRRAPDHHHADRDRDRYERRARRAEGTATA